MRSKAINADAHLDLNALRQAELKRAMGTFATGVTIVATHHDGLDHGMTCNSFNSVSLDPPMVLWSIRRQSHSLEAFLNGQGYSVSVLGNHQRDLAKHFTKGTPTARFDGISAVRLPSGRRRLADSQAWFDCELAHSVEAGDHYVLIGRILSFASTPGTPLIYVNGVYENAIDDEAL